MRRDPTNPRRHLYTISFLTNGFRGEVADLRKKATSLRRLIMQSYRIKYKGSHGTSDSPLVLLFVTHV